MLNHKNLIINTTHAAYGGYSIGRIDGKVILVDSALPGEKVRIRIVEDHSDYSIAVTEEVLESSPFRIAPECPVFGSCGGCAYLNVGYGTELDFKREIITEQLRRVAGITADSLPEIETIADKRYGYRSHTRFNSENGIKGFYRKKSNEIIPFPECGCLLLADELNRGIREFNPDESGEIKAASDYSGNIHFSLNSKPAKVIESEMSIFYHRDINGFFQANRFLRSTMIQKVIEFSVSSPDEFLLDICSGCGFFTLPLAKSVRQIYGFDIDRGSISHAKKNAKINGIQNAEFINLPESEIKAHIYKADTVVIDPPRSGLTKKGRRTVNAINPDKIVYVSCNPSTFARDLRDFMKNGYTAEKIVFIDMFPGTHHIELISLLLKL